MIRRRPRTVAALAFCAAIVSLTAGVGALEARVTQLRITGGRVWLVLELRDLFRDRFLALVRDGKSVFVQLQADLWEDRRVFDRVVLTVPPVTYRVDADPHGGGIVVLDQHGGSVGYPDPRLALPLRLDMGAASRIDDAVTYYVHAVVTAASVDEADIEQASEAIFGGEQGGGVAGVGRFVFRTLLRVGRYLESATAEVTSRRVRGGDIRSGRF